ncbi:unnamed protein product [Fraxinus pennsylvanica]|uniref:RHOMBOID-like protein n=1 Tax=Fraxinus pennsylvanica TaxID=56036 RepID=A0AAD1YQ46_9LAMI|nr:unnamed protein product [Fraxinus pennsylvanica]
MGALRLRYLAKDQEFWSVFTSPCLHAGVFHLIINLSCIIFVGIQIEQEFGPSRIGVIYVLSALTGSLVAALFGLLGAMLSGLIGELETLLQKGGFISVFLLGFVLLFKPELGKMYQNKGGLFEYDVKHSVKLKQKLDTPVLRSISLVIFSLL